MGHQPSVLVEAVLYVTHEATWKSAETAAMRFSLDKEKAIEALVYIVSRMPGVGRFHASKSLYFAEYRHLRAYGRPIVGDRYIAMDNGPVPSFVYDVLKGALSPDDRALAADALIPQQGAHYPTYTAGRPFRKEFFSRTDIECLDWAIDHCRPRSFGQISDETHHHPAWANADQNATMDYREFFDGVDESIIEEARAFSSYGVL